MYNKAEMIAELQRTINALQQIIEAVKADFKDVDTVDAIIKSVTEAMSISVAELKSNKRLKHLSEARFIVFYLLKNNTVLSLRKIGALVGNRDHSTVLYGINQYQNYMDTHDKEFLRKVKYVENKLGDRICV